MPETYEQIVNRVLRDHEGGGPETHPIGDRSTARRPVFKRDLRDLFLLHETSTQEAIDAAADAIAAADDAMAALQGAVGATFWAADQAELLANTEASFPNGTYFATRAEKYSYIVVDPSSTDHHLEAAGGVKLRVSPHTRTVEPEMFGAYGVVSVGDIAIVGTAGIPDETVQIKAMFDFAVLHGCDIRAGQTNRDYGVSETINLIPQENRNQGDVTATAAGGAELALHHSNTPSIVVTNPGNCRYVALAPMTRMFMIYNPTTLTSTSPYWMSWYGFNAHGNHVCTKFIETEWSYRNYYAGCKIIGFDHGFHLKWDAGSFWFMNEINCVLSGIWLDNAGDCTIQEGHIAVQKDGIVNGGGNNVRIIGVTFTGNVFNEITMVGVRLFGGSEVVANARTRGVHISMCEFAGLDWGVRGNDDDLDGVKEIWNITMTDNHLVRNAYRPETGMIWIRNGFNISLRGNGHGDLLNAEGAPGSRTSVYLENVENLTIDDAISKTAGNAIHLRGCQGGAIRSQFANCALSEAEAIVLLEDTTEVTITGCSVRWRASSPAATRFVREIGSSNRNVAGLNAIDRTKMADPYLVIGAASSMS